LKEGDRRNRNELGNQVENRQPSGISGRRPGGGGGVRVWAWYFHHQPDPRRADRAAGLLPRRRPDQGRRRPRPKEFPQEIRDQAGNQVTDGNQARIYANDFIGKHLQGVANGMTYASVGTKVSQLNAQLAQTPKDSPAYADLQKQISTLNAERDTLFKGETLRSSLLNAYGWWTIGMYTTYAAFGLMLAALVVLGALVFEVFIAARRPEKIRVAQKVAA